jgi:hypothetical protein
MLGDVQLIYFDFFALVQQPNLGIGHTSLLSFIDHAQHMVHPWTSGQLVAKATTYKTHKKEMHTYVSDHTATGISLLWISVLVSQQQNVAFLCNKHLSVFVLSSGSDIATQCNGKP